MLDMMQQNSPEILLLAQIRKMLYGSTAVQWGVKLIPQLCIRPQSVILTRKRLLSAVGECCVHAGLLFKRPDDNMLMACTVRQTYGARVPAHRQ
jgi:hypothetical protein